MKILVTGATGFIGNYVINELLDRGITVIATARCLTKAKKSNWFNKVHFVQYAQEDFNPNCNYFEYFKQPDRIIHLAWSGLPNYNSISHIDDNLFQSYKLICNLVKYGLQDVSIIGTCLEYGLKNGCLDESTPASPTTPYALSKDLLRQLVYQFKSVHSFRFKWIRLFYMYGDNQNPKSIIPLLDRALKNNDDIFNMSGGEQIRDYLPVTKVAEYISIISISDKAEGIINCCSGTPISIRKLIENRIKEKKKKIKLNLGYFDYPTYEPFAFWGNNQKLKKILINEQPNFNFSERKTN